MDRKWRSKEGFIVTFIDFSKAFDSLVWEALWKIMECLGCPAKLVAVVRSLYSQSTISIRLSMDGELAPSFVQKKGTRQGSGLSPCIFTMPVDFAMKDWDRRIKIREEYTRVMWRRGPEMKRKLWPLYNNSK